MLKSLQNNLTFPKIVLLRTTLVQDNRKIALLYCLTKSVSTNCKIYICQTQCYKAFLLNFISSNTQSTFNAVLWNHKTPQVSRRGWHKTRKAVGNKFTSSTSV